MTITQAANLMNDAREYPLVDRVAARIVLGGFDERSFQKAFPAGGDPLFNNVQNKIRDIQNGILEITPKLKKLAERL